MSNTQGLIPHQLKQSSLHRRYGNGALKTFLEDTNRDSWITWARTPENRPLRPDTTGYVSKSLGEACWSLIKQFDL